MPAHVSGKHDGRQPKLLDLVQNLVRVRHMSPRNGKAYVYWIKRFILFHSKRHPRDLGAEEIEAFLSDLTICQRVAASTQNQAFNAFVFLCKQFLKQEPGDLRNSFARVARNTCPWC